MTTLPNPFDPAASDAAAVQAVASIPSPLAQDAAADLSEINHIGEIFIGAEKLNDPEARFVLDVQAFMDAIDEAPLFLRQAV